jgi:hypothetical protein
MICKYCYTEHPEDQVANPHYCISRLQEDLEKAETALKFAHMEKNCAYAETALEFAHMEKNCAYAVVKCMQKSCSDLRKQLAEMAGSENEMANRYGAAYLEMEIYKKRYEVLRCMNPMEFHKLWSDALVGKFDQIVDEKAEAMAAIARLRKPPGDSHPKTGNSRTGGRDPSCRKEDIDVSNRE